MKWRGWSERGPVSLRNVAAVVHSVLFGADLLQDAMNLKWRDLMLVVYVPIALALTLIDSLRKSMKRSRFPNPPRPRKGTPEPDLGAEPIRLVSTMDITAETVAKCEFCKCAATVWWRGHAVCTRCQTYDLARKF